ncbi:sugar ABC transporter substrate-binding protein [Paenibacillus riograndensis]|uniref:Sugar ABC transporter substrate-binding protein n=1 Tax=Paenibacillus riograndensis TaxID=483937 RepID=A0A132TE35_9BACL|nr:sugar ABC transporter substrate-binding protein [Paenibacillus riograndensis]KWX69551.1 sugar ABC transporter substrate-binding protein [Paenibacillus riograndensis]
MKNFFKALSVTVLALSLTACGSANNKADTGNDSNASKDEGTLSFAFLPNTQNNTFQTAMTKTYEKLAKEKGVKFTMLDPDYDLNKQMNQMSDAANQGFDAVFVIPVDSAGIRQGLEQLNDKNIPVFNVDTAVIKDDRDLVDSVIATDAFMAGKLMGEQMVNDFPNGGEIAILDFPSNESCVQRVAGFMEGLGDNKSKFNIVAQQDGKAALDASLPIAEDIIQAHPDLAAIFAINDPSALGAAAAVEASGKNIGVYSIDASPDGKAALVDGSLKAVAAQVPIQIAERSFNAALDLMEGKEIEKEILLPSHVVTKEMAEETAGEWQ